MAGARALTVKQVLDTNGGLGEGFDFLRVALAISIVLFHSAVVTGNLDEAAGGRFWLGSYILVPCFFALSGFLITGSALRLSLGHFLLNRGLRIVPALAVEIFVSALIIGPIFTKERLGEYFSEPRFYAYFANVVGYIHYELPGLFLENPSKGIVNISLWTVPYEIVCYAIIATMIAVGLLGMRRLLLVAWCCALAFGAVMQSIGVTTIDHRVIGKLYSIAFFSRGSLALACFVGGCVGYLFKDLIPVNIKIFFCAVALCVGIDMFGNATWITPALNLILCPVITYITIFIGISAIPKLPLYGSGDYSYGIYLYAFPIQQALVAVLPWKGSWEINFISSAVLATGAAMLSWHLVEKRVLLARRKFSFVGRRLATGKG